MASSFELLYGCEVLLKLTLTSLISLASAHDSSIIGCYLSNLREVDSVCCSSACLKYIYICIWCFSSILPILLGCKLKDQGNVCLSLQLLIAVPHILHSSFRQLQHMQLIKLTYKWERHNLAVHKDHTPLILLSDWICETPAAKVSQKNGLCASK